MSLSPRVFLLDDAAFCVPSPGTAAVMALSTPASNRRCWVGGASIPNVSSTSRVSAPSDGGAPAIRGRRGANSLIGDAGCRDNSPISTTMPRCKVCG